MARFEVYQSPAGGGGYLLDVQADLLGGLNTRVVVPLLPEAEAPRAATHLNPQFVLRGERVTMVTQFIAAVPASELKILVGSLAASSDEILAAIDFMLHGW